MIQGDLMLLVRLGEAKDPSHFLFSTGDSLSGVYRAAIMDAIRLP